MTYEKHFFFHFIPWMRHLDCSPCTVGFFVWTSCPMVGHLLPYEENVKFPFNTWGVKGG